MILQGDALTRLRELPTGTVQSVCTSPPYYGLRDYGTGDWAGGDENCDHSQAPTRTVGNAPSTKSTLTTNNGRGPQPGDKFHADQRREVAIDCPCGAVRTDGQIGLEATPDEYVTRLVEVFREVRRVLRDDGTLWLNLGDSYANDTKWGGSSSGKHASGLHGNTRIGRGRQHTGLKAKDLIGIPWMVAFALRDDGWYLRSDIIWAKPNPMPESVLDRPTQAHEHVFLLTKSQRYFYDADAIREPHQWAHVGETRLGERSKNGGSIEAPVEGKGNTTGSFRAFAEGGRNKRNVWEIATVPFPQAHFATFPTKLVEPCVFAGTSPKACGQCGAPWQRIVERSIDTSRRAARRNMSQPQVTQHGQGRQGIGSATWGHYLRTETTGWEPTCAHPDDTGRCLVLDPFAGSGTVGAVSILYGREFIGIELNPDYCEMAEQRIMVEGRGGRLRPPPEQIDGQLSLLP